MKPTDADRKTRRLRELNERLDRNLAKGFLSLDEQREVFKEVVRRSPSLKAVIQAIRERN